MRAGEGMKDLYIVGAGGCGREVLQIVKDINNMQGPTWNIKGFLDDTEDPLGGKACDYSVVGTIKDYVPKANEVLVMGIASPQAKQKLVPLLLERGAKFETVIHPSARYGEFNTIGKGVVIYGGFRMSVNIEIGNFVTLLDCILGHDVQIGDFSTISGGCRLLGNVKAGNRTFMGASSIAAPYSVIEDDAYVGAGSVVLRRVKAGRRVFGNPARDMGF